MTIGNRQQALGNSKKLKLVPYVICATLFALCLPAAAQQLTKVARVGYLSGAGLESRKEAFRQGLRELGYVEGKNIVVEYRSAEGNLDRLSKLAAELVRLNVDVIFVGSTDSILAVKSASTTTPIVFAGLGDPVDIGVVASLARPGGNATGLTQLSPELGGKRLELLKEAFPKVARVAFLWNPTSRVRKVGTFLAEAEPVAKALGVKLQSLEVRDADDLDDAFEAAKKERAQAFLVAPNPVINNQRARIVELVAKSRLPAMYPNSDFVAVGGLMSYAPNFADLYRRAATYVDKILKGAKPADLPVEQPTKFELVINLKTAKQIALTIPPNVLARADRVIR
jgi:ABC-type uncharacterized transport system substrate-binding protein